MRTMKLAIAFALFMTSISFENQMLSHNGQLESNWTVSIQTTNSAFANMMHNEFVQNF